MAMFPKPHLVNPVRILLEYLCPFLLVIKPSDHPKVKPGSNPSIVSYNATSRLVRFENKVFSSTVEKRPT
jgi:hypothetical protein